MGKIAPEYVEEGERFRTARKMLGYTQSELAEKSGVSFASIKAYERGLNLPRKAHSQKLEEAGINMLYIATGSGPPVITPDMYPKPNMYVGQPMKDNPAILTIGEVPADYDLEANNAKVMSKEDLEQYGNDRISAERIVDAILSEIKFPQAHDLLKSSTAHLLQHKNITPDGARAMLQIIKDDYQFAEERIESKMRSQYQDIQIEVIKAQAEIARKEAEIAKKEAEIARVQAKAEIAEARLEIQQSQIDDFQLVKDMLKRTEDKLESTEEALHQLQKEVVSFQKKAAA